MVIKNICLKSDCNLRLIQNPAKNMKIEVHGDLNLGVTAKDIILHIIGQIGTAGGTGYVIEYAGEAISNLSMEGRMTICNMSIEAGARAGLIAPDNKTFEYIKSRGIRPFDYNINIEIDNDLTPSTWKNKEI